MRYSTILGFVAGVSYLAGLIALLATNRVTIMLVTGIVVFAIGFWLEIRREEP